MTKLRGQWEQPSISALRQQRRSKAARTLVRSTPKRRHANRQRVLRLGAKRRHQSGSSHSEDYELNTGGPKDSGENIARCGLGEPSETNRSSDYGTGERT
jgi:hypothetical protein